MLSGGNASRVSVRLCIDTPNRHDTRYHVASDIGIDVVVSSSLVMKHDKYYRSWLEMIRLRFGFSPRPAPKGIIINIFAITQLGKSDDLLSDVGKSYHHTTLDISDAQSSVPGMKVGLRKRSSPPTPPSLPRFESSCVGKCEEKRCCEINREQHCNSKCISRRGILVRASLFHLFTNSSSSSTPCNLLLLLE